MGWKRVENFEDAVLLQEAGLLWYSLSGTPIRRHLDMNDGAWCCHSVGRRETLFHNGSELFWIRTEEEGGD